MSGPPRTLTRLRVVADGVKYWPNLDRQACRNADADRDGLVYSETITDQSCACCRQSCG